MSERRPDLLIVGAGLVGLSLADAAARRGLQVTVLERERPGARASWAAAGMLNCRPWPRRGPVDYHDLVLASLRLYAEWALRLKEETDLDIGLRRCGALELYFEAQVDSRMQAEIERKLEGARERGVRAERISGQEARGLEPGLEAARLALAIHYPEDGQVRNPRLIKALVLACRQRGVLFRSGVQVADAWIEAGQARGVLLQDGSRLAGGAVALCAGAWSAQLPGLVRHLPRAGRIEPIRGQIVCFKTEKPLAQRLLTAHHRYLVPREDGLLLAGSTTERVGFDAVVTAEAQASLGAFAEGLLPGLKGQAPLQGWADLRPGLRGPHPLLGPVPGVAGLYLAAGHYRNGVCLAPVSGEILAAFVCGERPLLDPAPWLPGQTVLSEVEEGEQGLGEH